MPKEDRRLIGEGIKTAQFIWPHGEPLVKKLEQGIWEIRTTLENRIARVLITNIPNRLVLLHGFIKKTGKTQKADLELARKRLKAARKGD